MERFTNLRVILAQGHANLLCIVPILVYVPPKRVQMVDDFRYLNALSLDEPHMLCMQVFIITFQLTIHHKTSYPRNNVKVAYLPTFELTS